MGLLIFGEIVGAPIVGKTCARFEVYREPPGLDPGAPQARIAVCKQPQERLKMAALSTVPPKKPVAILTTALAMICDLGFSCS